jgi:anti-anti-sigma factor
MKGETAISTGRRADVLEPFPDGSVALLDRERAPATSLEADRFGLLAGPGTPGDGRPRMEDWIASNLDLEIAEEPTPSGVWDRLVGRLPALRRPRRKRTEPRGPETAFADWSRFRIAYRRGITVVRLVDRDLTRPARVRELGRDLLDLIEAGNDRVVLNFRVVERIASWVAAVVAEARRRCRAGAGGELKVCGLQAPLAEVFAIAGLGAGIECHPDETAALECCWPDLPGPRALPVEILLALTAAADIPPIRGGAPSEVAQTEATIARRPGPRPARRSSAGDEVPVSLLLQVGGTKGRAVAVVGPRFLIGRDQNCQLRLGFPMVSKLHAAIQRRDGRVFLRDLGSTNGTVLNGRAIRGREAELHHGDRIQFGPVVSTLLIGARAGGVGPAEEKVAEWLRGGTETAPPGPDDSQPTAEFPRGGADEGETAPGSVINHEVIQDILVVTPRVGELDNEAAIERLRSRLLALCREPLPRQVVVNLEFVGHVSGQAIGVLLAHHLRLDRTGGALRICQARARIMAILHQVRLTMLVECHPTLDEAVLSAWPGPPRRRPDDA